MADLDYTVGVNTTAAERNLANLQKSVGGINDTFLRFRSTLATISLSALFQQALSLSDTLQDLSDATEISTNKILGFSSAVAANGGTMDGAQKGLARLVAEIDGAANSAGASREAFKDVGVSLTDLRTKSSSQIFDQVIKGLAGIDDVAKRARLATELLGKEARNINFKNVADDFNTASASALRYSDAIKSSADANDNIAKAVKTFQLEIIKLIQPITDFINSIKISTDVVSKFFDYLKTAIDFAIIAAGFVLIVKGALALAVAVRAAYFVITELATSIAGFFRILFNQKLLADLVTNLNLLSPAGSKVAVVIEAMGTGAVFLANNLAKVAGAASATIGVLLKYFGLIGKGEEGPQGRSYSADDARRMQEYLDEQEAKIKRGQEAMAKFKAEISKANLESKQNLQIQGQSLSNLGFRLAHEKTLIGLSEDQKELSNQLYDLDVQRFDKQNEYARAVKKLQQERSLTKDEEANKLLSARINILIAEGAESDAQALRHKQGISDQLKGLQNARLIEKDRLQTQENIVKSIEDQISRQQSLGDILRGINDQKVELKFEAGQKGKSPFDQQIAVIQENARKAALEAGRTFAAAFSQEDGLSAAQATELANGLNQIANAYKGIADAQIETLQSTQGFMGGILTAWDDYKAKALDTASQVKDSFGTFTQGLEDAFVKFVQTGKLSFSDLANSIIADLARIAVRKAIVGLAAMFGFAAGGPVMAGTPIIVGERGPEMFVPQSAGKIVPNNQLGGSSGGSNTGMQTTVNYNIQAVDAASFRSLVARDPSFIYAVTEQGRRSQPTRSR